VDKVEGQFVVHTNEGSVPHLSVSSYYSELLNKAENDEELSSYLSDRINSAVWLIKSINQRKQTIYNVVSEVVKYQQDFFEKGPKYMKPMTLRVIADKLGVHESTVSRSINGKYMQCPLGVYEIRYFFSSGVQGDSGDDISSSSVKEFIKELVDGEDPAKPLSDQEMVGLLKEKGINISRRTIAKYRDEIGIPSSSRRRRY
jgi:RNA polymerase sigma-54 factor